MPRGNWTFAELEPSYRDLLSLADTLPSYSARVQKAATSLMRNRARYENIEDQTGVPWQFVAALHLRESGAIFTKHLHNGDPLTRRTTRVPAGHPRAGRPPFTWEASAIDALGIKKLDEVVDWSEERVCFEAERFNGFGYRGRGINSPYLWSGTANYTVGKYVADGQFSGVAKDQQLGVIPVWRALCELAPRVNAQDPEAPDLPTPSLGILRRIRQAIQTGFAGISGWFTYDNTIMAIETLVTLGAAALVIWLLVRWMEGR